LKYLELGFGELGCGFGLICSRLEGGVHGFVFGFPRFCVNLHLSGEFAQEGGDVDSVRFQTTAVLM
jgi:hypothetical protein